MTKEGVWTRKDEQGDPNEAFSVHQAWHNHVQTGLHLVKLGGRVPGLLSLVHSKSQVSAQEVPLTLQLAPDGSSLSDYYAETAKQIIQAYYALPEAMTKSERVVIVAKQLRVGESKVWTYLSRLPEP